MGLALAAIVKGYKLICASTDKQSKEKFDVLRAVEPRSLSVQQMWLLMIRDRIILIDVLLKKHLMLGM